MQRQSLPGFRDFFPSDFALRAHLFATWRAVAARYGFEEYDGPPLEPLELYTAKSGAEIVGQLYSFEDKGGRQVSLRPEMTPTLARMVAARANALRKPIRWFSVPQLFRYERQQRGRLREHFQLNCDLVGESGPLADAEIIALAVDVLRALGLTEQDVRVRLSDRRVLNDVLSALGVREQQAPLAYQLLDKLGRSEHAARRQALEAAGVAPAVIARLEGLRDCRSFEDLEERVGHDLSGTMALRAVVAALKAMGLGGFIELDFAIVRGLAYYTGTVFEIFDTQRSLRAICGGGRYDNLVQALAGVDLPCIGFGMGDVVLGELLAERGLVPGTESRLDAFIAVVTEEDLPHALSLAHQLRGAGMAVEYALSMGNLGKQLKQADARGARLAIVIGPDDRAKGEVQVKDLAAKQQRSVRLADVVSAVRQSAHDSRG